MLFAACPLLQQWSPEHEEAFSIFMQYKTMVPVCGAIMLNDTMDKVLAGHRINIGAVLIGFPSVFLSKAGKLRQDGGFRKGK